MGSRARDRAETTTEVRKNAGNEETEDHWHRSRAKTVRFRSGLIAGVRIFSEIVVTFSANSKVSLGICSACVEFCVPLPFRPASVHWLN